MSDNAELVEVVETVESEVEVVEAPEVKPEAVEKEEPADELAEARRLANRAVKRQFKAEAEADYLREQMSREQAKQQVQPQQQAEQPTEPDPGNYAGGEYDPAYIKAIAKHEARIELKEQLHQHNQQLQQERAQAAQRQTVESWQTKVEKATDEMPDFEEVIGSSTVPMPDHVKAAIMQSDLGPRLAYHLAKYPDEAAEINRQHPIDAIKRIARLEDKLAAIPKVSKAPDPIKPLGSGRVVENGLSDNISVDEWLKRRNKEIQQNR